MEREKTTERQNSRDVRMGFGRIFDEILWGSLLAASGGVAVATIWALWQIVYHKVALQGILVREPMPESPPLASGEITELLTVYALPLIFAGLACAAAYLIDRQVRYKAALLANGIGVGVLSTALFMLLVWAIYPPPSDLAEIVKYATCGIAGGASGAWLAYRSNRRYDGQRRAVEQMRRPSSTQHIVRALGTHLYDADLMAVALWQPPDLASEASDGPAVSEQGRALELAAFWPEVRPEDRRAATVEVDDFIAVASNFEHAGLVTLRASSKRAPDNAHRMNRWLILPLLGGEEHRRTLIGILAVGLRKRFVVSGRSSWRRESYWRTIAAGVASELEHVQHLQQTVVRERVLRRRDMHDGPKQDLFSLQMKLADALSGEDLVQTEPKSASGASVAALIEEALEAGERAAQDLTRMMKRLPPRELENDTLDEALRRAIVRQFCGTQIEYDTLVERLEDLADHGADEAAASGLSPAAEEALYRSTKEALSNVYKHSGAKHVSLMVTYTPNSLVVRVVDDGCGFRAGEAAEAFCCGEGLINMEHRMWEVGGTVSVNAAPGSGTEVIFAIGTQAAPGTIRHDETPSRNEHPAGLGKRSVEGRRR